MDDRHATRYRRWIRWGALWSALQGCREGSVPHVLRNIDFRQDKIRVDGAWWSHRIECNSIRTDQNASVTQLIERIARIVRFERKPPYLGSSQEVGRACIFHIIIRINRAGCDDANVLIDVLAIRNRKIDRALDIETKIRIDRRIIGAARDKREQSEEEINGVSSHGVSCLNGELTIRGSIVNYELRISNYE